MQEYFELCLELAKKAYKKNEVPIGAIVVKNGKVLSKAYNLRETKSDIMAHAEILAIKRAALKQKSWNLSDCELYVTLKPCSMCENVIKQSRLKKVYYLYDKLDYKKEYNKTVFTCKNNLSISKCYGILLSDFFKNKRKK